MPHMFNYADYDLISNDEDDASHLMFEQPSNEEEEPPDLNTEEDDDDIPNLDYKDESEIIEGENNEVEIVEDSDEESRQEQRRTVSRELRGLGIVPKESISREVRNLNTYYNPTFTHQVNLTLISYPGELKTMKETLVGPDKDKWMEAIKKEITNFVSRGVWKPESRKKVTEYMKQKLISTKWIFKKKPKQDITIRHKARVVSLEALCNYLELTTQNLLHQ
jgi:hypothetical protein